ncbi:hypothetical protein B7P43_G13327 [Cryptotermes secundus]|uniref:Uncharacterized protein n=1 Tax=Cryptotermes secundus TaxID=105785 RepID=A0A2J7R751_9NEOP|nr:hypothetical protein B7P43_G13327 [Cryptotermes secundus]
MNERIIALKWSVFATADRWEIEWHKSPLGGTGVPVEHEGLQTQNAPLILCQVGVPFHKHPYPLKADK